MNICQHVSQTKSTANALGGFTYVRMFMRSGVMVNDSLKVGIYKHQRQTTGNKGHAIGISSYVNDKIIV